MSSSRKAKQERIEQEEEKVTKPQKKQKNKKKKKEQEVVVKKNDEKKTGMIKQAQALTQKANSVISKQEDKPKAVDPITQELLTLDYDGLLTPCQRTCLLINSHLQQVTINLYELMIMKSSLIQTAIKQAKRSALTPKEYFAIDYTNKLLLIKRLLVANSANKYKNFVEMIDGEVNRVEQMVLRSLQSVRTFEEVLVDLRKNNVEWEVRE